MGHLQVHSVKKDKQKKVITYIYLPKYIRVYIIIIHMVNYIHTNASTHTNMYSSTFTALSKHTYKTVCKIKAVISIYMYT